MGWVVLYMCFFIAKPLLGERSLAVGTLLERSASSRQPPRAADGLLFLLNLCRPLATGSSALLIPTVVQIRFVTHNSLRPRLRFS